MSTRIVTLGLAALLAGGCSFIQSWNDYRPTGDNDGGLDSGSGDAGECNYCPGSCNPTDRSICVLDPGDGCYFCDFGGGLEGDRCGSDDDCEGALICELGRCLFECRSDTDCGASSLGSRCVNDFGRGFCLDHECDPVGAECGDPTARCYVGLPMENPEETASICSFPGPELQSEGQPCDEDRPCGDGLTCPEPSGGGNRVCRAWCYVGDGCDDASLLCVPLVVPPGVTLRFSGRDLGVCEVPAEMCVPPCRAGQVCRSDGTCAGCSESADCPVGMTCNVSSGLCITECGSVADCPNAGDACVRGVCGPCESDTECSAGDHCFRGDCATECTSVSFCNSIGYDDCFGSSPDPMICIRRCTMDSDCPSGHFCQDVDSDGRLECVR